MIAQAAGAGVTRMIAMGVDVERSRAAVSIARGYEEVWAGVGQHPLEPAEPDLDAMRELAVDPNAVAIGEVGLDFEHPGGRSRERQIELLETMFALAIALDLPVSVHNRSAENELLAAIARFPGLRGVMHYFTLDWVWAERFLAAGFHISFSGVLTRPSRQALREVARRCPADRLLLETDSPYGNAQQRMGVPNRPAYLVDTASLVAELRGLALDELAQQERDNAFDLFTKMR